MTVFCGQLGGRAAKSGYYPLSAALPPSLKGNLSFRMIPRSGRNEESPAFSREIKRKRTGSSDSIRMSA
jgi:hypothetical protein